MGMGADLLAAEWREAKPQTPEEIWKFYESNKHQREDLDEWHTNDKVRQQWTEVVLQCVLDGEPKTVLDFGAGGGHDLLAIRNHQAEFPGGLPRLVAVEPNVTLREQLHGQGIEVYASLEEVPKDVQPDMIIAIDVFEHLPNPKEVVGKLLERLPLGGCLVEATGTGDIDTPLHLYENWGWKPDSQVRLAGFKRVFRLERLSVWQRHAMETAPGQSLLLCIYGGVQIPTLDAMEAMQKRGWNVMRRSRDALISRSRSALVSQWWREAPDDVFLMIDADIVFRPDDADKIVARCRESRGVVGAAYAWRGARGLAVRILADEGHMVFSPDAAPMPAEYLATGFMAVHRDVIDAMVEALPICHPQQPDLNFWPFFMPFVHNHEYLSEDWAFVKRARDMGFPTLIDPSIRLGHIGEKMWTLEDTAKESHDTEMVATMHIKTTKFPARLRDEWNAHYPEGFCG